MPQGAGISAANGWRSGRCSCSTVGSYFSCYRLKQQKVLLQQISTHLISGSVTLTCTAFKIHNKNMNSVLSDEFRMNVALLSKIKHFSHSCVRVIIGLRIWGNMVWFFNFLLENMGGLFIIKFQKSVCLSMRSYFIQLQN